VHGPGSPLSQWSFARRDLRDDDVAVQIRYCGVCGSDLHAVRHGNASNMPLVTGHEMTGTVTAISLAVTGLSIGDMVAIGNVVDSCGTCPARPDPVGQWFT
jgi:alcohol dehydrogenase (NADP+)